MDSCLIFLAVSVSKLKHYFLFSFLCGANKCCCCQCSTKVYKRRRQCLKILCRDTGVCFFFRLIEAQGVLV